MISPEKWMILTSLQKLPNNVGDLGKIIIPTGFEWLPKVQKIAQSGHTAWLWDQRHSLHPWVLKLIITFWVSYTPFKFSCIVFSVPTMLKENLESTEIQTKVSGLVSDRLTTKVTNQPRQLLSFFLALYESKLMQINQKWMPGILQNPFLKCQAVAKWFTTERLDTVLSDPYINWKVNLFFSNCIFNCLSKHTI